MIGTITLVHVALGGLLAFAAPANLQDAYEQAERVLADGSSLFNEKDHVALAATYTEDARIELMSKTDTGYSTRVYEGRKEIQDLYQNLFSNAQTIESRNVVEYAQTIGDDFLIIVGTFEPDLQGGLLLQFIQVRTRGPNGEWKISNLRLIPISTG